MPLCTHPRTVIHRTRGFDSLQGLACWHCGGLPLDVLEVPEYIQNWLGQRNLVYISTDDVVQAECRVSLLDRFESIGPSQVVESLAWALIYSAWGDQFRLVTSRQGRLSARAEGFSAFRPTELHRLFALLGYIHHERIEESPWELTGPWIREKDPF